MVVREKRRREGREEGRVSVGKLCLRRIEERAVGVLCVRDVHGSVGMGRATGDVFLYIRVPIQCRCFYLRRSGAV